MTKAQRIKRLEEKIEIQRDDLIYQDKQIDLLAKHLGVHFKNEDYIVQKGWMGRKEIDTRPVLVENKMSEEMSKAIGLIKENAAINSGNQSRVKATRK